MRNEILWQPSREQIEQTAMHRFVAEVRRRHPDVPLGRYADVHRWSVRHYHDFWRELLDFTALIVEGDREPVLEGDTMPSCRFFPELRLNFAENLLRTCCDADADARVALVSVSESRPRRQMSYARLLQQVAAAAAGLRRLGLQPGDRVAAMLPNIEEAVVAMLATTSIGAVWTSCSPDFGVQGVLDRFGQIKPRLLLTANAYCYGGKLFDCLNKVDDIAAAIPEIERIVVIPYVADHPQQPLRCAARAMPWAALCEVATQPLHFLRRGFNDPAYVLYSSGTTGVPKCIVHGIGGTLLQHAKELLLHSDLRRDDNIMYFTTCGWMMWNWLVSSLLAGATITLFDGSPTYPALQRLWQIIDDEDITHFGTSPKFLGACRGKLSVSQDFALKRLRVILSTGAPLLPEDFDWIYQSVKADVQLSSISGGTDIISCFMLGNPTLPVIRGEIQCLGLGMDVAAYNDTGQAPIGERGELVCRTPFVSMPVGFWNDPDASRCRAAYFTGEPGTWYHGDYVAITGSQGSAGGVVVYGRSDATLNPGGVRIGTAEIYRLVETMPEIDDSIVIGQPWQGDVRVVLFVRLAAGVHWSDALAQRIGATIRQGATPRHVPAVILPVEKIPYTISGKKVELAVLQIVSGKEPANKEVFADATALDGYRNLAALGR